MSDDTTTPSPLRQLSAAVVVLSGIALVVLAVATRLPARSSSLESLVDDLRPLMADETVAAARADLDSLDAAAAELWAALPPLVAQANGVSDAKAVEFLSTNFPATMEGLAAVPAISERFGGMVDLLDEEQERFASTDAIPVSSLSARTVGWGIIVAGVGLALAGAWTLRGGSALPSVALGTAVVVVGVGASLPAKSSDADTLSANVAPIFTEATVAEATAALGAVDAMATELSAEAFPALGAMLGLEAEQFDAVLAQEFPASSAALAELPATSGRFGGLVATIDANLANYDDLEPIDLSTIVSLVLAAAGAAMFAGLGVLVLDRR